MQNKEKSVQEMIIASIRSKGGYAINVNAGSMFSKRGKFVYKIELAPKGTPDILACIEGIFYGIEVKKNEKERFARLKIVEKYIQGLKQFKSHEHAIQQRKIGAEIAESGGTYICTYSVAHFRKSQKIKSTFLHSRTH